MPNLDRLASCAALRALAPLFLTLVVGACVVEAPAEERWVIRQTSQEIRGGSVDESHTSVVGIINRRQGGACSGTLIAPNLVLTAQHCVASTPLPYVVCGSSQFGDLHPASSFSVTTRTNFFAFDGYYDVVEVAVPPGNRDLCGSDIAVIFLEEPVAEDDAIPYIPRIDITAERSERYSAHGYGETGSGDGSGAGTRRWITGREVVCDGPECQRWGGDQIMENEWIGTEGTCQGDSGGPALDEELRVFGVLSRGGDGCSSSVYSAVDDHGEWLREQGERAAQLGGYYAPPWVTTGSSDATIHDADADGVSDEIDNCLDNTNPSQEDMDGDGLGDACDPIDNRDRGGSCDVCNGCTEDADCPGGTCVNFGSGGVCSIDCSSNDECPASTSCFQVPDGAGSNRDLCLNDDAGAGGVCHDAWVCGGEVVDPPSDGCDICRGCSDDRQCGSGLCLDFGSGGVCTADCSNADCPGDSACFDVDGRSVCLNPDASEGVCDASYACDENGGGSDGSDYPDPEDPGSGLVPRETKSGGCSTTASPTAPWVPLLLALVLIRRRR